MYITAMKLLPLKRKILFILVFFHTLLFAQGNWIDYADTDWYTGDKNEYVITTPEQLAGLAKLVNDGNDMEGITIKLGNNIMLNDTTDWKDWDENTEGLREWTSIGYDAENAQTFLGTFDGDRHIISGLYSLNSLFRLLGTYNLPGGTIQNLGIVASYTHASLVYNNYGSIINCYVKGNSKLAGLVGYNEGSITNSYAIGNVKSENGVGGLVNTNGNKGTITNSYVIGNVKGENNVGGLVGWNWGSISNCYTITNILGNGDSGGGVGIGGLVGMNGGLISNSYTLVEISAVSPGNVGGLVGRNENNGSISNSYAIGSVLHNTKGSGTTGGLVGSMVYSTILNSYALVDVNHTSESAYSSVGGLIGFTLNASIYNSYYNTQISRQNDVGKGEGRTTAQMQRKDTYVGWDFETIWDIDGRFYNDGMPYFKLQNTMRHIQADPIEPQLYTGFSIKPRPELWMDGTKLDTAKFEYHYDLNIHVATGGTVYIISKDRNAYFGALIVPFIIKPARLIEVSWFPKCGEIFTYNGELQSPEPFAVGQDGKTYDLTVEGKETNAGIGLVAMAKLATFEEDVILQNNACAYAIEPKELQVTWTGAREYVYNKMNQSPIPSIDENQLHDELDFIFGGYGFGADEYKGSKAAYYMINPEDPNAGNYRLNNNRAEFTIHKKQLKPFFTDTMPNFETNKTTDTLWVPREIFANQTLLQNVLNSLMSYDGFATNIETNESDDEKVLSGKPTIELSKSTPNLSKRVETTQKATATIVTDNVSAENYALTRPTIIIMETIDESEDTEGLYKVFCYRDNYCAEISKVLCQRIEGEEVQSCATLRKPCLIYGSCYADILIGECTGMGGIVAKIDEGETCSAYQLSTLHSMLSTPHSPLPRYYNLKGTPLGTAKPTIPGVYIEKVGKQARKILVK